MLRERVILAPPPLFPLWPRIRLNVPGKGKKPSMVCRDTALSREKKWDEKVRRLEGGGGMFSGSCPLVCRMRSRVLVNSGRIVSSEFPGRALSFEPHQGPRGSCDEPDVTELVPVNSVVNGCQSCSRKFLTVIHVTHWGPK